MESYFLYYQKNKNTKLFESLEKNEHILLKHPQNYIPIYNQLFDLNESNWENLNLKHTNKMVYIDSVSEKEFVACIEHESNGSIEKMPIFTKFSPILNPLHYMCGKYRHLEESLLFTLSKWNDSNHNVHDKIKDPNNSSYVEGFFTYLSSRLLHRHGVVNGVDFYGSFLGIKEKFKVNVYDDVDYLNNHTFYCKNINKLFFIDETACKLHHLETLSNTHKPPIRIIDTDTDIMDLCDMGVDNLEEYSFDEIFASSTKSALSPGSVVSESSFPLPVKEGQNATANTDVSIVQECNYITLQDVAQLEEYMELGSECSMNDDKIEKSSNYSSSSIHSGFEYQEGSKENESGDEETDSFEDGDGDEDEEDGDEDEEDGDEDEEFSEEESSESYDEEVLYTEIHKFPAQMICMEKCTGTLDHYLFSHPISDDELLSMLMQVIMTLLTYQKAFHFTHNDLHTNNVMYIHTDQPYIYYVYHSVVYRVPTYGKIYKIIDFGRSIYRFNKNIMCSHHFSKGEDAATQYNTEPYFDERRPRIDPNYSFDLCRFACCLFDYFITDLEEIYEVCKERPILHILIDWCNDDSGKNILYKKSGEERYPEFKLYKMIARTVHKHTPAAQLNRREFMKYIVASSEKGVQGPVVDIDQIPCYA